MKVLGFNSGEFHLGDGVYYSGDLLLNKIISNVEQIVVTPTAQHRLRQLLTDPCPRCKDLTDDQVAVAMLEIELLVGQADGIIEHLDMCYPHNVNDGHWEVTFDVAGSFGTRYHMGQTKREVFETAVTTLRGLQKPKLPEPEDMKLDDVAAELNRLGYKRSIGFASGLPLWGHDRLTGVVMKETGESWAEFTRRALCEARSKTE